MGRWEPNAQERLRQAAMELYIERGYDDTTVAQIAERAGLTERTFFRHFADKREVLFSGSDALQKLIVGAIDGAPPSTTPIDAVGAGLEATTAVFQDREFSRRRQSIIAPIPELRERELIKMASLASTIAEALRRRGVKEPAASLAAEAGIAVFKIAYERWIDETNKRGFRSLIELSLKELKAVTAGDKSSARPTRAVSG
jgi:AcrR family transcriptional regulator